MTTLPALVSLISFALQQFLQLLDPIISRLFRTTPPAGATPDVVQAAALKKKVVMGVISSAFGLVLFLLLKDDSTANLNVLKSNDSFLDAVVSAFVIGAGTEASNTVQKLLSYTKDKIKPT